jgi:hypothetical protein
MEDTDKLKLPARCPRCGGPFEGGFGRLSLAVRGFWPNSCRPIGIYNHDDTDEVLCRTCFGAFEAVLHVMSEYHFAGFQAGAEYGERWMRAKMEKEKQT